MKHIVQLAYILAINAGCFAQPTKLTFEVASIRPAPLSGGTSLRGIELSSDRVHIGPMTLSNLIALAYDIKLYQIKGPAWLTNPKTLDDVALFNVEAKLPTGTGPKDVPQMLQTLLAERFSLRADVGTMEADAVALRVAKNGPKLPPPLAAGTPLPAKDAQGRTFISIGAARLSIGADGAHVSATSINGLMDYFSTRLFPVPAFDETGLTGDYDIQIDIEKPDPTAGGDQATRTTNRLSDAVAKLGLKLEPRKATVKSIIVNHIGRTPSEN